MELIEWLHEQEWINRWRSWFAEPSPHDAYPRYFATPHPLRHTPPTPSTPPLCSQLAQLSVPAIYLRFIPIQQVRPILGTFRLPGTSKHPPRPPFFLPHVCKYPSVTPFLLHVCTAPATPLSPARAYCTRFRAHDLHSTPTSSARVPLQIPIAWPTSSPTSSARVYSSLFQASPECLPFGILCTECTSGTQNLILSLHSEPLALPALRTSRTLVSTSCMRLNHLVQACTAPACESMSCAH